MKKVTFGRDAQEKILAGAKVVADAVGSTLGPKANNVAIARPFGNPSVIHDGVSVAKEIELEDAEENLGAQLIIEAAQKTNDNAGDGTTTATILTYAMAREAIKNIAAGANAMMLRKGMEATKDRVVTTLKKLAKPIASDDEIKQIATISAQSDEIGMLIHAAIKKLGKDCIIAVEESNGTDMEIEYKQGMQFDKGYKSGHFITNPETQEAIIEDPYILITDAKITNNAQIAEWGNNLQKLYSQDKDKPQMPKSLVIIAQEVSGIALVTFIQNKLQGFFNVVIVEAPQYGEHQKNILGDIATVTGGKLVSEEAGDSLATMKLEDYGHAKRAVSTKDSTMIIDGAGSKILISERADMVKAMLDKAPNEFETEKLKERIAKLTSGIAVINVGASTEMEMREKKERCIDAIEATKAAIAEGVVPGGQVAYLTAVKQMIAVPDSNDDFTAGYRIVMQAIKEPFRILMENSGYDAGQMLERLTHAKPGEGIDVTDGQVKDVIKAGIIDPVKVSRVALENAVSTAGAIMTTNTIITELPKHEQPSGDLA